MISRFRLRGLVRDYCLEYLHSNPGADLATAKAELTERLTGDFGDTHWIELLLRILEVILPLLLDLFTEQ